jgi:hypothetical protein
VQQEDERREVAHVEQDSAGEPKAWGVVLVFVCIVCMCSLMKTSRTAPTPWIYDTPQPHPSMFRSTSYCVEGGGRGGCAEGGEGQGGPPCICMYLHGGRQGRHEWYWVSRRAGVMLDGGPPSVDVFDSCSRCWQRGGAPLSPAVAIS